MVLDYSSLSELRHQYGDSFYFLDIGKFKKNFSEFKATFERFYPKVNIGYSYKTNYIPALCASVDELGGYAEVVSEMEYDLAIKVGVSPENIIVNGPYKPFDALSKFLLNNSLVNLDSFEEVKKLKVLVAKYPEKQLRIGLRCNFDIENDSISRFGFDALADDFAELVSELTESESILLEGFHCHFPDRNLASYKKRVEGMLNILDKLTNAPLKFIDLGGGYFGKMHDSLAKQFGGVHSYHEYAEVIGTMLSEKFKIIDKQDWPLLILEPGSALVADTMDFVCSVVDIKDIRTKHLAMCSGSKFNIGLLTSSVQMPMEVFNGDNYSQYTDVAMTGFTCIESDYLCTSYRGELGVGSFVKFANVGSYSVVFKPPFIMPNVPIISFKSDDYKSHFLVKRQETVEDIFATYEFGINQNEQH